MIYEGKNQEVHLSGGRALGSFLQNWKIVWFSTHYYVYLKEAREKTRKVSKRPAAPVQWNLKGCFRFPTRSKLSKTKMEFKSNKSPAQLSSSIFWVFNPMEKWSFHALHAPSFFLFLLSLILRADCCILYISQLSQVMSGDTAPSGFCHYYRSSVFEAVGFTVSSSNTTYSRT